MTQAHSNPSSYPASAAESPAGNAVAVTPADTDLSEITRAVYVGTAGDLVVTMAGNGQSVTFANVTAGSLLPIRCTQINSTTGADNIVAVW